MKLLLSSFLLIVAFASCKKETAPEIDQRILVKYETVATAKFTSPSYVFLQIVQVGSLQFSCQQQTLFGVLKQNFLKVLN